MREVGKLAWYGLLVLRWVVAALVGVLGLWLVYNLPIPYWASVVFDAVLVTGVLGGTIAMGPVTYKQYQALRARVARESENRP